MARLTTYESNRADAWDTGMSEPDDLTEDHEMASLRAAWDLMDGYVPRHARNPAAPHWHDELTPGLRGVADLITPV